MIPVCPFGVTSLMSLVSLVSLKGTLVHGEIVSAGAAFGDRPGGLAFI